GRSRAADGRESTRPGMWSGSVPRAGRNPVPAAAARRVSSGHLRRPRPGVPPRLPGPIMTPDPSPRPERLASALREALSALDRGRPPDVPALAARYPELPGLAADLSRFAEGRPAPTRRPGPARRLA